MIVYFYEETEKGSMPIGEFGVIQVPRQGEHVRIVERRLDIYGKVTKVDHVVYPPRPSEVRVFLTKEDS